MIQKKYGTILLSDSEMNKQLSQLNLDKTSSTFKTIIEVPLFFDGRKTWSEYINEIDYQSNCVSCWAFATLFVLSSRLSIYTKGKYNLKFSTAKMIFQKNNLIWDDVKKDITIGNTFDKCPATTEEMICHRVSGYYYVPGTKSKNILFEPGNESNIRREIYHWGPCSTVMRVFQDFLDWDGIGIYKWDSKSKQINSFGHAIVLIGWGEESGIKYWIARNSWGENWSDKGYFKIVRGLNNCEIEENVFVGYPTLPSLKLFIEYPILYRFDDFIIRGKWGIQDNGYKLTSYEKLLLKNEKVNDFIYDVDSWTNFSNFIAGNGIIKNELKEEFEEDDYNIFNDEDLLNKIILLILFFLCLKIFCKCKKN